MPCSWLKSVWICRTSRSYCFGTRETRVPHRDSPPPTHGYLGGIRQAVRPAEESPVPRRVRDHLRHHLLEHYDLVLLGTDDSHPQRSPKESTSSRLRLGSPTSSTHSASSRLRSATSPDPKCSSASGSSICWRSCRRASSTGWATTSEAQTIGVRSTPLSALDRFLQEEEPDTRSWVEWAEALPPVSATAVEDLEAVSRRPTSVPSMGRCGSDSGHQRVVGYGAEGSRSSGEIARCSPPGGDLDQSR